MLIGKYRVTKDYFKINTNWEDALNLLYKNSKGSQAKPDVLWFKIKNRKIFNEMPDLKPFFEKLNKEFDSEYYEDCEFYNNWETGICNCKSQWHMDGLVISLDSGTVGTHKDVLNAGYIQILGQSFWRLDGEKKPFTLNPGDVVLISNKITHEVWGEGPRMGMLLFTGVGSKVKPKNQSVFEE